MAIPLSNRAVGLAMFLPAIFPGHLPETLQEQPVRQLHDIGLVPARDPFGAILLRHLECILDDLQTAGPGDKTTAQSHILRQHMFDAAISIFDVLSYNGDVDGDTGL